MFYRTRQVDNKKMKQTTSLSVGKLTQKLQKVFNAYIRERDKDLGCISCGSHNQIQAGHFYSAGHYPSLRFNEDNVHSQCLRCNYFLSANLLEYRKRLLKKIGEQRVQKLDLLAAI